MKAGVNILSRRRNLVKKIKLIVLILLTVVFIVYGIGFMTYSGINNTLLDQQYYRSVVGDYNISAIVHGELSDMIPPIVRDGLTGGSPVTDPMKKAAVDSQVELISKAITDALDEAWIEDQAVMVTDDVVSLLNGEKATLSAVIDLNSKLDEIEQNIATSLEEFSDAELFAIFGAPRAYIPTIAEQIVSQLGLPESLVIADLVDTTSPGILEMSTGYLETLNSVFGFLAWIIILVFLILCMLFWKVGKGLQWFGISTILTGGIFLGIINYFSDLSRTENLTGATLESLPISTSTLQSIIKFTFSEMNLLPVLFLVGGIVLFILGIVIHKAGNKA
jgi:hypothetical protein